MYNMTGIWAANNIVEQIGALNTASGDSLIIFFMFTLYISLLFIYGRENMRAALLADSFIMVVISALSFGLGWIQFSTLIIPIMLVFVSLIALLFVEN